MKLGLIQSQGIGDIVIALPIAKWYADRGHQVFWPVNGTYADFLGPAAPYVTFLPLPAIPDQDFMAFSYDTPLALLQAEGCEKILTLNMNLPAAHTIDTRLASSLKFDEYKYAVACVPFAEKWTLALIRDMGRERTLHKSLNLEGHDYICVHFTGSNVARSVELPQAWRETHAIVEIDERTPNPLDWLYTIEHAAKRVMIDSVFSNLTEQLNIIGENYLVQRSVTALTPVYKNGWRFVWPGDIIVK